MNRSVTPDCFAEIENAFSSGKNVKSFQRGTTKYATIHGKERPKSANFFGEKQSKLSLPKYAASIARGDDYDSDEDDRASLASIKSTLSLAPEAFNQLSAANRLSGRRSSASLRRRSSSIAKEELPYVRTKSMSFEKPLGTVYLLLGNQCKKAIMPNQITSLITIRALFVRAFPDQLSLTYLEQPNVAIYFHDQAKDVFRELENLGELRDKSILKVFETNEEGIPIRSGNEIHKQMDSTGASKFGIQPNSSTSSTSSSSRASKSRPSMVTASVPPVATTFGSSSGMSSGSGTPMSTPLPPPMSSQLPLQSQLSMPLPPPPSYSTVMSSQGNLVPAAAATIVSNPSLSGPPSRGRAMLPKSPSVDANLNDVGKTKEHPDGSSTLTPSSSSSSSSPSWKAASLKKPTPSRISSSMKQKSASLASIPLHINGDSTPLVRKPAIIRPITPAQLTVGTNVKSSIFGLKLKTEDLKKKVDDMKDIQVAYMRSIDKTIQQAAEMMMTAVQNTVETSGSAEGDQLLKDLQEDHPVRLQRLQVSKFHRAFSNDMTKVSQELSELEATVEEIRNKVINEHCLINASSIETLALNLNTISEAYGELKKTFPVLQQRMRLVIQTEMQLAQMEESYLDTEALNIDNSLQRCKKLSGTLLTMRRLATVQQQK